MHRGRTSHLFVHACVCLTCSDYNFQQLSDHCRSSLYFVDFLDVQTSLMNGTLSQRAVCWVCCIVYFFTAVYAGHPLTSVQNFTEIVPGEPLCLGH